MLHGACDGVGGRKAGMARVMLDSAAIRDLILRCDSWRTKPGRNSSLPRSCAWSEPERGRWLSWEHRRLLIHAAKTALAAGLVLVAGDALRTARWVLGRDQRDHCSAVELRLDDHCLARSLAGHTDRRCFWVFVFAVRDAALELHSGRARGGDGLRPAWIPQQLAAGGSDDHDRDAGAECELALARSRWTA